MIEQINHLAQLWWDWMSAMFWQVGLLIALIALLDRLIRRWAWPQLRYAMWSVILIKLVLSPTLHSPGALAPKVSPYVAQALDKAVREPVGGEKPAASLPFLNTRITEAAAQSEPHLLFAVEDISMADDSAGSDTPIPAAGPRLDWRVHAMCIWLLGVVTLGLWLLIKLRRLSRAHCAGSPTAALPRSFYDQLAQCAKRLSLRRKPAVVVTNRIQTPAVFGLFRPVLLMPIGYIRSLSRRDTEYLLLHELAHIKRGDLLTHNIYMVLQVVYWFNPLLWLVRRRLRHLRELCCDATVASLLRDRTPEYRRTLLEAARQFLCTPVEYGLGLVGLFEDSNCLISRINWLEKPIWRYQRMKKLIAITIIGVMLVCVLPMAVAQQDSSPEPAGTGSDIGQQQSKEQLLEAKQDLEAKLQTLEFEMQKLRKELQAMAGAAHAHQAAQQADHVAADHAHQAAGHAAQARQKAKQAKDKAAQAKALAKTQQATAQAEHWEQWAQQMEKWAQGYEKWAESDKFKQWQADMEKWAKSMAQMSVTGGVGSAAGPAPKPMPMPVMPPMPAMPAPTGPALPFVAPQPITPLSTGTSVAGTGTAPVLPGESPSTGRAGGDVEVKKDKDGKYVATRQMQFASKVGRGAPFVIRNDLGRIVLRPSKDGRCDVRAVIRAKADTDAEARAKVEQMGMTVNSSKERFYLRPVMRDGGKWENLNVDLFVTVPAGVEPDLETKMGSVELYDFNGKIKAVTKMGSIKAVNTAGDVELYTKMGSVDFAASKDLSAKMKAQTKMGSIDNKLALEMSKSGMFQKGAQGTLGSGDGTIRITTDMGSIKLRWHDPSKDSTKQ